MNGWVTAESVKGIGSSFKFCVQVKYSNEYADSFVNRSCIEAIDELGDVDQEHDI
jgi:hypothetical protein